MMPPVEIGIFLGKEFLPTDSVKDPTLSFDCQTTALAASSISRLAQINRAKQTFNPNLLVTIINAYVLTDRLDPDIPISSFAS